jgi:hypothetical protein
MIETDVPTPADTGKIMSQKNTTNSVDRRLRLGIVAAGLLTGVTDGSFASGLRILFYHSPVGALFQGVAAVLLGPEALKGGTTTVLVGILMHFGVAFGWSIVFATMVRYWAWLREVLKSPFGVIKVAAVYGPFVWLVMSLAVIPSLSGNPPAITSRWWTQFFGHMVFVGLPIVGMIWRTYRAG